MSSYIDRDLTLAGIEDLKKSPWYNGCNGNYESLIRREAVDIVTELCIKQVPAADVVEIVRCKNCKHFCPYEGEEHKGDCAELVGLESCVYEDDFCSYGERKDGDEE